MILLDAFIIKYKTISTSEVVIFCIMAFLFAAILIAKSTKKAYLIIPIIGFVVVLGPVAKRIMHREPKVVIDEKGVIIVDQHKSYEWEIISNVYIDDKIMGYGKNSKRIDYLYVITYDSIENRHSLEDMKIDEDAFQTTIQQYLR